MAVSMYKLGRRRSEAVCQNVSGDLLCTYFTQELVTGCIDIPYSMMPEAKRCREHELQIRLAMQSVNRTTSSKTGKLDNVTPTTCRVGVSGNITKLAGVD